MSDQEKKETEVTQKTFNVRGNDFSGNKGHVNIGETIKNQYSTVNNFFRKHPLIGMAMILVIGILIGTAVSGEKPTDVVKDVNEQTKPGEAPPMDDDGAGVESVRELRDYEKMVLDFFLTLKNPNDKNDQKIKKLNERFPRPKEAEAYAIYNDELKPDVIFDGTIYIGSDASNYAKLDERHVYILVPPEINKGKIGVYLFSLKYYDSWGKYYISWFRGDSRNIYSFENFMSTEYGEFITKKYHLDWRPVQIKGTSYE